MEKRKLKLLSITLAAVYFMLTFTFLSTSAVSDTSTYEIPELAMTMDIPSNIKVVTQGIRQSDPIFSNGMFDYIQTMSKFREHDDYFYGKDSAESFEFEVTLIPNENNIENLTKLSEKKQNSVMEYISNQSDVINSSIYKTDNAVYIESLRSTDNSEVRYFSKEYYTIYNGYDVTIKLTSKNDNLINLESDLLKTIVDSVSFPKEKKIDLTKVLSASELFCFCLITASFVILVISKIQNIKREKYRAERQQNRMKERMQRDAREKQAAEQEVLVAQSNESVQTEDNSENKQSDKTGETKPEIDLDEAIANFENSARPSKKK